MTAPSPLQGVEDAIAALEQALGGTDACRITAASSLLGQSLCDLGHAPLGVAETDGQRLNQALARVEGLRTRVAMLTEFNGDRLQRAGAARGAAPGIAYDPRARLRVVFSNA